MSRRTKEKDALQKMGATLNKVISAQSNATVFASAASSAGFISSDRAVGVASMTGVTEYAKVGKIMAAVTDNITMCGVGGNLEKVTEKYNKFVLLVYHELELTELAVQLVDALRELKSGYVSPLPSDVHDGDQPPPNTQATELRPNGSGSSREANGTSNQASAVASSDSSTSVNLSELLEHVELSDSALKKKCTEEHLRDIAREMDNWEYYASYLGLSTGEIDDLKEEFKKTGVKKERCLLLWKQKAGFKANYRFLVENVFLKCENAEMAEYVCRLLK